ncbi:MAG: 4-hydroxy-tetrahydrodipicolinate synthase [Candidatus ainarchaeum sp.]|nr:4-hydroxy-tetrahydrodipicolinate synthase [Candidatus ainarchaeum sp.]
MREVRLEGAFTAMVTPFTGGEVDAEGLARNADYQVREGISGLLVLGTTGEAPTLSWDEREKAVSAVVQAAGGRVPVIAGTGTNCTRTSVQAARQAEKLGADALLVVCPYYNKPMQDGIFRHYKEIAESTALPIIVYNIAGRTARNIETPTLLKLAQIENVVAVKEASGSLNQIMDVVEKMPEGFTLLSGDDSFTLPAISVGGKGVVSVASNLLPGKVSGMVRAALKGDFAEARRLHYELYPLFTKQFVETNPIPIKAAMGMAGMPAGEPRPPLYPLSEANVPVIKSLVEKYFPGASR